MKDLKKVDTEIRKNVKRVEISKDFYYKGVDAQLEQEGFAEIKKGDPTFAISERFKCGSSFPVMKNDTHMAIICQNGGAYPNSNNYEYSLKTLELSKLQTK